MLLSNLVHLGYTRFKMVSQAHARRGAVQSSGGMSEDAPGEWLDEAGVRGHPYWSEKHMHVLIDKSGNRNRVEHDLHAKLTPVVGSRAKKPVEERLSSIIAHA